MAGGSFYAWIEESIRQEDAARAPWLDWWDIAHPTEGPVAVAMPWRTMTPGAMQHLAHEALLALPGPQRVTWIGLDPQQGLVHAAASWDPATAPRPLPPASGWQPCKDAFFHAEAAYAPDRVTMEPGHRYASLPMPSWALQAAGGNKDAVSAARQAVEDVPLDRFLQEAGLPHVALKSMLASFLTGAPIPRDELPRYPVVMKAVLWVCGNDPATGVLPAVASQRRRQAIEAMPCFAKLVMGFGATHLVVDPARRLVPWLADHLGLDEGTVRALGAASARSVAAGRPVVQYGLDDRDLLTVLDAVPRSLLPTLLEGETSPRALRGLAAMSKACIDAGMTPTALRYLGRTLRPGGDQWNWLSGASRWNHLYDVAVEFERDLLWPAAMMAADPELPPTLQDQRGSKLAVAAMLLASLGPSRLAGVIDAHMAGALRRAAGRGAADGEAATWPALAQPVMAGHDRVLRFLTSLQELAIEGMAMNHCVGDYADDCADGRCAILSIGRWTKVDLGETWVPSSTVEIVRNDEGGLEIAQHYGRRNDNPPGADVDLLADWMDAVAKGDIPLDDAALADASQVLSISHVLGSSWATPEASAARWDCWRRILDVRQRNAADFVCHAVSLVVPEDEMGIRSEECRTMAALVIAYDEVMVPTRMDLPSAASGLLDQTGMSTTTAGRSP